MPFTLIFTPDLYLAMLGLFAFTMFARTVVRIAKMRRARVAVHMTLRHK